MSSDRIVQRFEELIGEGKKLRKDLDEHIKETPGTSRDNQFAPVAGWMASAANILKLTIPDPHLKYLEKRARGDSYWSLHWGINILESALDEVRKGFVKDLRMLVEVEVHDDLLVEATQLLTRGSKNLAAMLCRVVIERSLRSLAKTRKIKPPKKLAALNEALWKAGAYNQSYWRVTQGHIDVGNSAAHGHFDEYDHKQVAEAIKWTRERILASQAS